MKERPILFSGPMVKAILDGRKTQTRRVVRVQPSDVGAIRLSGPYSFWDGTPLFSFESNSGKVGIFKPPFVQCPYGKPGDRLWVRETWKLWEDPEDGHDWVLYRSGGRMSFPNTPDLPMPSNAFADRWRPSIHMFRWMSRINLEITSVRVEQVQNISAKDVESEGVDVVSNMPLLVDPATDHERMANFIATGLFEKLWDSINRKKYPWKINPWVWVVEFKIVQ